VADGLKLADMLNSNALPLARFFRKGFLAEVLCLLVLTGSVGFAEDALTVIMPSRVNLVPWTLDTVKRVLERDISRKVSLSVRSDVGFHWPDPSASGAWLLLEEGVKAPVDLKFTGIRLSLLWMMAVRSEMLSSVASKCPSRLDEFFKALDALKKNSPGVFPWFESLYSAETLRCFTVAFAIPNGSEDAEIASQSLKVFHQALDGRLLNPLSIESDEGLAFDVFEARDSVFSSMWVVEESWTPTSLLKGTLAGTFFVPVPGIARPSPVPQMQFSLWSREQIPIGGIRQRLEIASFPYPVIRLDSKAESAWKRDTFSSVYDQLIQGGNE